ncbi:MAG: undecaprenyl/decaprenyl-phosphate alpha-N-acetylglucosaminyl 1-phosphate transferase [Candidatus Omnitrophica bacterium]|nr:undecaprenyl/decaprenyl-phosphate alpha-N-acetylglucosaminyl 1-phosphate transferase [Candidatus Omnitrophota bacterium]MBU4148820.1 undecaprenyl/decaprenyl-phosphate alpha-N-acetylglucosaminyl 1-phosphate transferase [Candidatus Omnitrophota bacterium]
MIYFLTFCIVFILTLIFAPATIKISERFDIFATPKKGEIKGKPCLGGIGIFAAFTVALLSACFFRKFCNAHLSGLIIASGLISALGVIDDAKNLDPLKKIIGELIAILILVLSGTFTKIAFFPIWVNILITFIWILFITNAFNLLDIVDGLTSGLVIIVSLTFLVISLVNKDFLSSVILVALIGSHLGFLRYNYPPARLYMGDTGSLFSGFVLAAVAINISYSSLERTIALVTPVLALSLPIYDTFFLMIMRVKKGKSIFNKTNDHFALRLLTMGNGVRKSIWIMYLFSIFLAISSLIVVFSSNAIGGIMLFAVVLVFVIMGKKVGMVKIDD